MQPFQVCLHPVHLLKATYIPFSFFILLARLLLLLRRKKKNIWHKINTTDWAPKNHLYKLRISLFLWKKKKGYAVKTFFSKHHLFVMHIFSTCEKYLNIELLYLHVCCCQTKDNSTQNHLFLKHVTLCQSNSRTQVTIWTATVCAK